MFFPLKVQIVKKPWFSWKLISNQVNVDVGETTISICLQVTKGHQLSPQAIDALAEAQLREVAIGPSWVWISTWEKKHRRLVVVWNSVYFDHYLGMMIQFD